jgi:hypothetical protein
VKKPNPEDSAAARRTQQPANSLNSETREWLATLPASVRPQLLAVDFARVANALRLTWGRPDVCLDYFDDLLIDRRGDRLGFPAEVVIEIAVLKDYYQSSVHPSEQSVWEHISKTRH